MNAEPTDQRPPGGDQAGAPRGARGWLGAPAGRAATAALGGLLLLLPLWLWVDPLDGYTPRVEGLAGLPPRLEQLGDPFRWAWIIGDDFPYLAEARTAADLRAHLWEPHNSHVVPLFRAWTFLVARLAGSLGRVAAAFALASWLTYAAAAALLGRVVARETGRPEAGLVAVAAFGVSTVLEESVRWYSAGQAIASGVVALAMLDALQGWRLRGGGWRLAAATLLSAAAPLVWSAGLVAGPAGAAYLWADVRPRSRRWAVAPLAATAVAAASAFVATKGEVVDARNFQGRSLAQAVNPVQGAISTAQASVEILMVRNLGLVADSTPAQALAVLAIVAAAWPPTRGARRCNPLEAAGAAMTLLGFGLAYTARGYYPFEELRDLHWYQAVPQMGAVLFAAGWWSGRGAGAPAGRGVATRRGLLAAGLAATLVLALQVPRERARLAATGPALSASEREKFPIPPLERVRARFLRTKRAEWQRRCLARLDEAEARARAAGWSRAALRAALGGPAGPKIWIGFARSEGFDPVALLALPESGPPAPPGPIRAALLPLLTPEPYPVPGWLDPGEGWEPAREHDEATRPAAR